MGMLCGDATDPCQHDLWMIHMLAGLRVGQGAVRCVVHNIGVWCV
jgi:hypothetical protein